MGATIVLGDDLHVLVPVAPMQLVLDAELRKMGALVEVREIVLMCPLFRSRAGRDQGGRRCLAVAVRLLQPLLVLAA